MLLTGVAVCIGACVYAVDNPAVRAAPVRPTRALVTISIAGVEYVNLADIARRLGLKGAWRGTTARTFTLSDKTTTVQIEADNREIAVNGRRVFLGSPIVLRRGELYMSKIDFERNFTPLVRPALVGHPPQRPRVIALDPGHGGDDPGMENKRLGLQEKALTLDVALRVEQLLKRAGYGVVLTRRDDRQLGPDRQTDWRRRSEVANRAIADLFISIHFNSLYPDTKTSGTEVYSFTPQHQRSTRAWSPGEKDDIEQTPAEVNRFDPWSALLAHAMHGAVMAKLKTFDRGQKTMHSGVLRGLYCPGVLVEAVFLSHENEARQAATPEYRQQIAEAIADGVRNYAETIASLEKPTIVAAEPAK